MTTPNSENRRQRQRAEPRFQLDEEEVLEPRPPSAFLTLFALAYRLSFPLLLIALLVGLGVLRGQLIEVSRRSDEAAESAARQSKDVAQLTSQLNTLAGRPQPAMPPDNSDALAQAVARLDAASKSLDKARADLNEAKQTYADAVAELRAGTAALGKQKNLLVFAAEVAKLKDDLQAEKKRAEDASRQLEAAKKNNSDPAVLKAIEEQKKVADAAAIKAQNLLDKLDKGELNAAAVDAIKKLREDLAGANDNFTKQLAATNAQMDKLATRFDAIEKRFQTEARPTDVQFVALNTKGFRIAQIATPLQDVLGQYHSRFANCRFGLTVFTGREFKSVTPLGTVPEAKEFDLIADPGGAVAEPAAVRENLGALLPPPAQVPPGHVRQCILVLPFANPPDPKDDWAGVRVDAVLIDARDELASNPAIADSLKGWLLFCTARGGTVTVLSPKDKDFAEKLKYQLRRLAQPQPR